MMRTPEKLFLSLGALALLAGCSSASETLGLSRTAPDEFAVIRRAPLSMPPSYAELRPPEPGISRPQEMASDTRAKKALLGEQAANTEPAAGTPTTSERLLLQQAGAAQTDPEIRKVVDMETAAMRDTEKPVAEKLLGVAGVQSEPAAKVVDARAESERLLQNRSQGKPVTEGKTPVIED